MSKKYNLGAFLTIKAAELLYSKGVASVVTDARYVQIEKEVQ